MRLTKCDATKDFAFLTLISEEVRDVILKYGLVFQNEKIRVSITRDKVFFVPLELCISTLP